MIRVFDGHSDILSDVTEKRLAGQNDVINRHHLERLKKGGTEGAIFVIWVDPPYDGDPSIRTRDIMNCAKDEFKEADIRVVSCFDDIENALHDGKFYVIPGIEGLSAIGADYDQIDRYYEFGCRHAMLTWNEENALATGVRGNPERGLTEAGKKAVKKIYDRGMIMDVSHLNERSFWDVAGCANGMITASHSNAKALCNAKRNLTNDQIKEIGRSDGIIGINSYAEFAGDRPEERTAERLVEHVLYIADLIGIEHVGCGFDFFEFLNEESMKAMTDSNTPAVQGIEDSSKVQVLFEKLKEKGLSQDELEMIGYKNWHRVIRNSIGDG